MNNSGLQLEVVVAQRVSVSAFPDGRRCNRAGHFPLGGALFSFGLDGVVLRLLSFAMRVFEYETVTGFFVQDNSQAEVRISHYQMVSKQILPRFGLMDPSPDRWTKFAENIRRLNETAAPGVQYKVFYIGRHGEGYHNVAEAKYGGPAWSNHWTKLNGDGEMVWGPDAELTPLGEQQAQDAHDAWEKELAFDIPLPQKLYSSPLTRAIRTNQITWTGTIAPSVKMTIVENIREHNGVHTCDKRRTKSEIHERFPDYLLEEGFSEKDELWKPNYRETEEDIYARAKFVLDMIFNNDKEQFVSITTHAGFTRGFLRVSRHSQWNLPTGGVIPLVVKATDIAMRN